MSWPGFHAPSAAWFFLLIPPLVLLYFLKLKRPRLSVPSLALWAQVMQDKRVNSPFQRFKRNILLWLQLLILCLLVLAAMLPFFHGTGASNRVLLLIDNSASMGALDKLGGESRLAVAKQRAREVIDGLGPSQEAAIITFARTARQVVPFTNAQRVLRDGLDRVDIVEVASDVQDALRMADAMARSAPFDRVLLFSDGNLPAAIDFDLPFELEFEKLPPAGPNLGITSIRARRAASDGWSVFVRVQGSPGADIPCALIVISDGEQIFREPVHPRSGGQRFVFPVTASEVTKLHFKLEATGFDSLAVDNHAYLALREMRPLRVLVPERGGFFHHALQVIADVDVHSTAVADVTYDLVVTTGNETVPQTLTALHTGYIPDDLASIVEVKVLDSGTDTVVDWRRNSVLLEHVEMTGLDLGEQVSFRPGAREADLDNLRYEVLAYGQKGPILVQKADGGQLRYLLLFDPARSTLPFRVGFPILVRNLVTIAMQRVGLLEVEGPRTGVLAPIALLPDTTYSVDGPGGSREVKTNAGGMLIGVPAPRAGLYEIRGSSGTTVGASLLSVAETVLSGVDRLDFNELSIDARKEQIATDRSIWSLLAMIALAVLLTEWWFFQARPGGYLVGHP